METINTSTGAQMQSEFGNLALEDDELRNATQQQVTEYICGGCGKNAKIDKDAGIRC